MARGGAPPLLDACAGDVTPAAVTDGDIEEVGKSRVDCSTSAVSAGEMLDANLNNDSVVVKNVLDESDVAASSTYRNLCLFSDDRFDFTCLSSAFRFKSSFSYPHRQLSSTYPTSAPLRRAVQYS